MAAIDDDPTVQPGDTDENVAAPAAPVAEPAPVAAPEAATLAGDQLVDSGASTVGAPVPPAVDSGAATLPGPAKKETDSDRSTLAAPPRGAEPPLPTLDVDALPIVLPSSYTIESEYARGGMGRVLKAFDQRLRRPVAIKELLARRPDAAARFVREALVTARLQHPSIVPVHEAGRWPSGEPFYAMKLIVGRPLEDVIKERATLAERLALLPALIAVAEAMAYAHSRRVIHRDLKPANVVVGEFGETMVIDWGLAKQLDVDEVDASATEPQKVGSSDETQVGAILGTPGYMPPEQAMGRRVDERADVYALGAILYTALAGAPPYVGRDSTEILAQVILGPPEPLGARQPGVPADLLAVVDKAMARAPVDRYATAQELARDLKRFQTGQLVGAHQYSTAALLARFVRRHRLVLSVAGCALALVAATGAFSVRRVVRERDRADHERAVAVERRAEAEAAQAREAARVDELIVAQARASLDHDPTATLAWLKRLRENSARWPAARIVAEEAAARGAAAARFEGGIGALYGLVYAPDGKLLAAGHDGARVFDRTGGTPLGAAATELADLALSADGRLALAAGGDGVLRAWNRSTGEAERLLGHHGNLVEVAVTPDGKLAVSGGHDGTARLWDLVDWRERAVLAGRGYGTIAHVALSPDGALAAAQDAAGVRLWTVANAQRRPLAEADRFEGDGGVRFSPDGKRLAVGGRVAAALFALDGSARQRFPVDSPIRRVAFSPDGKRLAAVCEDGSTTLWELAGGKRTEIAHHGGEPARDVAFSPDGAWVAAARGSLIRLYHIASGELRKLRGHAGEITRVVFAPDGKHVASASLDGSLRVWNVTLEAAKPPADPNALRAWLDGATTATFDDHDRLH